MSDTCRKRWSLQVAPSSSPLQPLLFPHPLPFLQPLLFPPTSPNPDPHLPPPTSPLPAPSVPPPTSHPPTPPLPPPLPLPSPSPSPPAQPLTRAPLPAQASAAATTGPATAFLSLTTSLRGLTRVMDSPKVSVMSTPPAALASSGSSKSN
ncbi:unnamed protein product, partial [Closterium sp. NIES-54]